MEIANMFEADELLEQVASLRKKIEQAESARDAFCEIYLGKIERAKAICEEETLRDRQEVAFLEESLKSFALKNLPEGKKTIALPSGRLSFKKQPPKYYLDGVEVTNTNEKLLKFCREKAPEYVKQKVIETADWSNLKKQLVITGNEAVMRETGELIDGLTVQEFPDKFTVTI